MHQMKRKKERDRDDDIDGRRKEMYDQGENMKHKGVKVQTESHSLLLSTPACDSDTSSASSTTAQGGVFWVLRSRSAVASISLIRPTLPIRPKGDHNLHQAWTEYLEPDYSILVQF